MHRWPERVIVQHRPVKQTSTDPNNGLLVYPLSRLMRAVPRICYLLEGKVPRKRRFGFWQSNTFLESLELQTPPEDSGLMWVRTRRPVGACLQLR